MDASSNALGFGIAVDKANIKGLSLNNGLLVLRNNTAVLQPAQVAKCFPPGWIPGGSNRNSRRLQQEFLVWGFCMSLVYP